METECSSLRRRLLCALPAGMILAGVSGPLAAAREAPSLLTCWSDSVRRPRQFRAGLVNMPGRALALPARGHDVFWHPSGDGSAVVVARRPGQFMFRWDVASGRLLARFDADDSLRLEGHVAFDHSGERILASETDLFSGAGQVGVYDALTLERVDGWASGGIGPHALRLLSDGRLAVANGGILTLPETGRVKRNLDSMDSSLALIDPLTGRLLEQYRLPDRYMSIRHVAESASGVLAVALQNEGGALRPLFARVSSGALEYGRCTAAELTRCGTYAGDIAGLGPYFAVSCSTAGATAFWDRDGTFAGAVDTPRVCALAASKRGLVATGDAGDIWMLAPARPKALPSWRLPVALDNHGVSGSG